VAALTPMVERPKAQAFLRPTPKQASGAAPAIESFNLSGDGRKVTRNINLRKGGISSTSFLLSEPCIRANPTQDQLAEDADAAFLKLGAWPALKANAAEVRVVDLFSGCGLMSLGVWEAARALGRRMNPVLAVDFEPHGARVYKANYPTTAVLLQNVRELLPSRLGSKASYLERQFAEHLGAIEVLIGGPPCQGHSDLNNYTRRLDPKNRLYNRMARLAELVKPTHIIIENVPAVTHDKGRVVQRTSDRLVGLGYNVDETLIEVSRLGVPQRRRRHVLVASLTRTPRLDADLIPYLRRERSVKWAISDLRKSGANGEFDRPSVPTTTMKERIDYLFNHGLYNLPDSQRPKCHKDKNHTYTSVYGRMQWGKPAQTITSGFTCMGQGRFVHSKQRRTLTPHEAARLQFVPDFFRFPDDMPRMRLAQIIGNAVPSKLAYVLALELLR
jgi:DNA (cytosine-5)-methyltransferase 1